MVYRTYRRITGETILNCGCGETDVEVHEPVQTDYEDYVDLSTHALSNAAGDIACQRCGCRGGSLKGVIIKEGCKCECHV
jgi:hypothetical protein